MHKEIKKTVFEAETIYLLNLTIIRGRNIKSRGGSSAMVECLDQEFKTAIIKNNNNPEWNKSTAMYFYRKPQKLVIKVLDHNEDKTIGAPIGYNSINLDEYFHADSQGFEGNINYEKRFLKMIKVLSSLQNLPLKTEDEQRMNNLYMRIYNK